MFGFLSCAFISFWNAFLLARFCLICWNSFICFIDVFLPVFLLEHLFFQKLTSSSFFILMHFQGSIMLVCPPFHLNLFLSTLMFINCVIYACFLSEHKYNRFIVSFSRIVTA